MSILSALKQQNSSLDDLATLPQAMIMQMAQKKQISQEMLAPILARKAELAEAFARQNAMQSANQTPPTVMEQLMAQNAQAEQPQMPPPVQQPMPQMAAPQMAQAMPQGAEDVGIATQATAPMSLAGGGIIAFADGGMSEEDEDYEDALEEADYQSMIERAMNSGEDAYAENNVGIKASTGKRREDGDLESRLRAAIMAKESGGRRYDRSGNILTSSKGAEGEMQVMPATARDPGFGIKPAQGNNPDELRRVGDEYASVLLRRYRDPKLAMIAYNMGPGATDKWLASGADPRRLPKETQGYIGGVNLAKGGEVRHFASQGYVGYGEEVPYDSDGISLYDTFGSMLGSPLERLRNSIYGAGAKTNKELQQDIKNKKTASTKESKKVDNAPAPSNVPPKSTGLTVEEMMQGSTRAGTWDALSSDQTTGRALPEAPKSRLDAYMDKLIARESAMAAQKNDDKNMALLTAGLGMLGGTSQHGGVNIGQGALAGVQQYGESKKQRAAEQAALDKSMLYANRYQGAEEIARQNAAYNRGLQGERLEETRRANTNKEVEQAQSNLNNYIKIAQANLKDRFPAGEMDERYQAAMAQIYKSPEYIALSKRAGLNIAPQGNSFAGFSATERKK
jgi:soluble lytic murein transglycosylase-like protein